jgi:chromosome segregation ATPase
MVQRSGARGTRRTPTGSLQHRLDSTGLELTRTEGSHLDRLDAAPLAGGLSAIREQLDQVTDTGSTPSERLETRVNRMQETLDSTEMMLQVLSKRTLERRDQAQESFIRLKDLENQLEILSRRFEAQSDQLAGGRGRIETIEGKTSIMASVTGTLAETLETLQRTVDLHARDQATHLDGITNRVGGLQANQQAQQDTLDQIQARLDLLVENGIDRARLEHVERELLALVSETRTSVLSRQTALEAASLDLDMRARQIEVEATTTRQHLDDARRELAQLLEQRTLTAPIEARLAWLESTLLDDVVHQLSRLPILREELEATRTRLDRIENERLSELGRDIRQLLGRMAQQDEQQARTNRELERLDQHETRLASLDGRQTASEDQGKRLEDQLREHRTDVDSRLERLGLQQSRIEGGFRQDLSALNGRLETHEADVRDRLETLEALPPRLGALETVPARLEALETLPTRLDELAALPARLAELEPLNGRVEALETLQDRLAPLESLPDDLRQLTDRVAPLEDLSGRVTTLEAASARLETVETDLADALETWPERLNELDDELRELTTDVAGATERLDELTRGLDRQTITHQHAVRDLRGHVTEQLEGIQARILDLDTAQGEHLQRLDALSETSRDRLDALEDRAEATRTQLGELDGNLTDTRQRLASFEEQVASGRTRLEAIAQQQQSMEARSGLLAARLQGLESVDADLRQALERTGTEALTRAERLETAQSELTASLAAHVERLETSLEALRKSTGEAVEGRFLEALEALKTQVARHVEWVVQPLEATLEEVRRTAEADRAESPVIALQAEQQELHRRIEHLTVAVEALATVPSAESTRDLVPAPEARETVGRVEEVEALLFELGKQVDEANRELHRELSRIVQHLNQDGRASQDLNGRFDHVLERLTRLERERGGRSTPVENAVVALEARVDDLESLDGRTRAMHADQVRLETRVTGLEARQDERHHFLGEQQESLGARLGSLGDQMVRLEKRAERLPELSERLEAQQSLLTQLSESQHGQDERITEALDRTRATEGRLTEVVRTSREDKLDLWERLAAIETDLGARVGHVEQRLLVEHQTTVHAERARLSELEKRSEVWEARLADLCATHETWKELSTDGRGRPGDRLEALEQARASELARMTQVETAVTGLDGRVGRTEDDLDKLANLTARTREQVSHLDSDLGGLRERVTRLDETVARDQRTRDDVETLRMEIEHLAERETKRHQAGNQLHRQHREELARAERRLSEALTHERDRLHARVEAGVQSLASEVEKRLGTAFWQQHRLLGETVAALREQEGTTRTHGDVLSRLETALADMGERVTRMEAAQKDHAGRQGKLEQRMHQVVEVLASALDPRKRHRR